MTCRCGHSDHDFETGVCVYPGCWCMKFEYANGDSSVFFNHTKYLNEMVKTEEKVRYLLTNIKFLRNYSNKNFVFAYWVFCDGLIWNKPLTQEVSKNLTDPETIRRSKQNLVQKNPEAYGEFNEDVTYEKAQKQLGIEEFLLQC